MKSLLLVMTVVLCLVANCSAQTKPQVQRKNGEWPVVSPDGRWVAFTSDRDGQDDLYVIRPDGSGERRLTKSPKEKNAVAWSADGKRIRFSSIKDDLCTLYEVTLRDGKSRELLTVKGRAPQVSPDEKKIIYTVGNYRNNKFVIADADGANPRDLNDSSSFAWNFRWSPDGTRIAFTSTEPGSKSLSVYTINSDGKGRRKVSELENEGRAQVPAWSADGRKLAVQVNNDRGAYLWILDLTAHTAKLLSTHTEHYLDETPNWFPDGRRIAFQSDRTGRMEIWVTNIDGTNQKQLTH